MLLQRAKLPAMLAIELFLDAGWGNRLVLLQGWSYRFGVYGAINLLDDPAWLALMFC
jgi:hypothetical protein